MNLRKHLKAFVFNLTALWFATELIEGVAYANGYQTILMAAFALTLINLLVRPLIKLLFLPINLITLGAFRWLINVVALYLVTLFVPQFKISPFFFAGFSSGGFSLPQVYLGAFWVYVIVSLLISLITTFLFWLTKCRK